MNALRSPVLFVVVVVFVVDDLFYYVVDDVVNDDDAVDRRYDNFRFVEHRRLKYGDAEALALSALAEVPDQYRAIRALGIMEGEVEMKQGRVVRWWRRKFQCTCRLSYWE